MHMPPGPHSPWPEHPSSHVTAAVPAVPAVPPAAAATVAPRMRDSKAPLADSVEQSTPSKPVWHAQVRLRTWQVPWPEHAAGQMVATTRWHASPSKPEWHVHLPSVPQEPRPLHPSGHAAPGAAAVTAVLTRMVPTVFTLVLAPATLLHSVPSKPEWHSHAQVSSLEMRAPYTFTRTSSVSRVSCAA